MGSSYRDLRVWQLGMALAVAVYRATELFPKHELYGLTSQLRRASTSIPSNIAEGKGHRTDREFLNYLFHARGLLLELETQLLLSNQLNYLTQDALEPLLQQTAAIGSALTGLINSLQQSATA